MPESLHKTRFVSRLTRQTLALVLAGGRGSRLHSLTEWRAKPAVPFGGKFRIIDFPLSNCLNSGIRQIGVLTQYKADSLIRHIQQGWGFLRGELGEFVDVMPAQQRMQERWYAGTADAVYQNLDILRQRDPEYIVILAGDHVYKMDYGLMLAYHAEREADLTIGCIEVPLEEAKGFGVMHVDDAKRVINFVEKPAEPPPMPNRPDHALASMGIYIFSTAFLFEQLIKDADNPASSHDFGHDIIPNIINNSRVFAYPFRHAQSGVQAYWRDVGTVDAYWSANMELIGVDPELNLYDREWPIWTYQAQTPPAKFIFDDDDRRGMAVDSMVSGGCIISGSEVRNSLLFTGVRTHSYSSLEHVVALPRVIVNRKAELKNCVVDSGVIIPDGLVVGQDAEEDARWFRRTDSGIVLVTQDMLDARARALG